MHQAVERRDAEPEAERHRLSDRRQTPAGGETASWGTREEGERAAVGDEGESGGTGYSASWKNSDTIR